MPPPHSDVSSCRFAVRRVTVFRFSLLRHFFRSRPSSPCVRSEGREHINININSTRDDRSFAASHFGAFSRAPVNRITSVRRFASEGIARRSRSMLRARVAVLVARVDPLIETIDSPRTIARQSRNCGNVGRVPSDY